MFNYRDDGTVIKPTDSDHVYSKYMEGFYSESPDPWGNTGRYVQWFKGLIDLFPESEFRNSSVDLVDLGCGGGNVLEGLINQFSELTSDIKVTGIDISQSTINRLNQDERFNLIKSQPFICKDLSDEDLIIPNPITRSFKSVLVYSIVDVLYYIRDYDWHLVADRIIEQIPINSYIIVADNFKRPQYRHYYRDKHTGKDGLYKIIEIGTGQSKEPVIRYQSENSGRWINKYLSWSVYQKLGVLDENE